MELIPDLRPSIIVQFGFKDRGLIPAHAVEKDPETEMDRANRGRVRVSGRTVIPHTIHTDAGPLLDILEETGYALVDCWWQRRRSRALPNSLRYLFVDARNASAGSEALRTAWRAELQALLDGRFWCVRAMDNPFYQAGQMVEGKNSVSINIDDRTSLEGAEPNIPDNGDPLAEVKILGDELRVDPFTRS